MSFVWRRRLFLLLLPLLLAVTGWQIRIESDLNAFFTATDDEDSALLAGLLRSGELSRRYLIRLEANAESGGSAPAVRSGPIPDESSSLFTSRFIQQLSGLEGVQRVWPANEPPRDWISTIQAYAPFHAGIYSLDPEQEGHGLFDPGQLGKKADGLKRALLSPQGGFIKPIAKQDPLLLSLNGFKNLQNPFEKQTQPDSGGSSLILQSSSPALDAEVQKRLQTAIRERFDALNGEAGGSFRLAMTGIPVFTVFAQGEISGDIALVSTLSTLGVALVFLLLFHSFSALHWMMLIQAASFALGTLATALVFGHIHSLTLALGASLIGICTDYPIHVLAHCAKHRGFPPLAAARLLWPSLVMGGLTTIVGYAALGLTGFPGLEQIAVFAAAGIAASLGLTRWVLPALLGKASLHPAHLPGIVAWIGICERRRYLLLGLFALSIAASLLALPHLRWMDDLEKLAIDMSELKRQDEAIRSHFTGIEPGRFVLVQAKDLETALQRSEAAERRLKKLKETGALAEYHGLFPWLVSARLQAENAKTYRQARTPEFQQSWKVALKQAGLAVDKLGELAPSSAAMSPQERLATPVRQILSGQIIEQDGGVALAIWLGEHDPGPVLESLAGLEGVRYFSQKDQLNRVAQQHRDRSLVMLAVGVVVMSLLIWLQQRNIVKVLLTLLPSLASCLFIFAAWAMLGEEVSFLHVIGLLLSISLCVDYGIFFMDNRGRDADITYHAIASSTLTTVASFGALGLAKTPTLPILAVSVSLGVSLGFLLCPLLISSRKRV